jgi:transposase InsO family protein
VERQAVLDTLHDERFCDQAPASVWATLLDESSYLASVSTMYRQLRERGETGDRRRHATHPARVKPEPVATHPNQVWSWDITKFRVRWAAHNVRIHTSGVKRLHHPVVGDLELAFESFPLAADPSQSLLTYTAEPGSPSQNALRLLASWAATTHDVEQPASTDDSQQAESVQTPD